MVSGFMKHIKAFQNRVLQNRAYNRFIFDRLKINRRGWTFVRISGLEAVAPG
ncbi:hypothetical protein ANN_14368 [Periplaneta americana]|uniref:Uncharacterized protein n=1 Tax=Periplaneta americana TaxID=6978 RepID=A0ABQ8SXC9_PERAM|nr:hypothetical protein ANN_14368 [Periplaneta americana]